MCGRDCKCQHGNVAYSGAGKHPGVYEVEVKVSGKTALQLANADDEDD